MPMTSDLTVRSVTRSALFAVLALYGCERPPPPTPPRAADISDIAEPVSVPGWLTFKASAKVDPKALFKDHAAIFHLSAGNQMVERSEEVDELGVTHLRYQQTFQNVEVEGMQFMVRARGRVAISANGGIAYDFRPETVIPAVDEARAWTIVQQHIPADRYYRDDNVVDDIARATGSDPAYRPKGKLVFTVDPTSTSAERRLAFMFKVYVTPFDRSRRVYVDAAAGTVLKEFPLFPSCHLASGPVTFRGTRAMNTQKNGDQFRLKDDCDGNLLTADLLDTANKIVAISDDDNDWAGNNPSVVTSYWGLRAAYDYFHLIHNRRSYDGKNASMAIYNDPAMRDAGHNATGGSGVIRIGLATAGNDNDDYNTLDIIGHELTHSVIETTAGLSDDATKESAALMESFADIFGQLVEDWIEGGAKEWVIGDDKGCVSPQLCRDLKNPKAFNNPDTYQGTFWQTGGIDPHNNGSVQNRWFALLCDGGVGTNAELGSTYNVAAIGTARARRIAYRTLTRYLYSDSGYVDARQGSISAAVDLFGSGSRESEAVTNAWCAVGLCPYVIPKQPDVFDRPGGNPNPASPNNNNSLDGATPLGTAASQILGKSGRPWTYGKQPTLRIPNMSIFPQNDVDYFEISFPEVDALGGRCFSSGFSFAFDTNVNARIFADGALTRTFTNTAAFSIGVPSDALTLEVSAPFPGQIISYRLNLSFFLHYKQDCFATDQNEWDQIQGCPMCDQQLLKGIDRVILEPSYRQQDQLAIQDHYFSWSGEGPMQVAIDVLQGNNLHAELIDETGAHVATVDRAGTSNLLLQTGVARPGVYSLRFSGFGNGTELVVRTPQQ